jgi:hypothetical protein
MEKIVRWTARVVGILYALLWLSQIPGILENSAIDLPIWLQVLFLAVPTIGLVIAWRRELAGGAILIAQAVFAGIAVPFVMIPGTLLGGMFLYCGWRARTSTW